MLGGPAQAAKHILHVDPDALLSTPLRYSLEVAGYAVCVATSGAEALAALGHSPFDLVLLEIDLPDLSGIEVCRAIRRRSDIQQPAIIIASARAQEADRIAGFCAGADDFVSKPFGQSELLLRIRARLLGRPTIPVAPSPPREDDGVIRFGPLIVDQTRHQVFLMDREIKLSVQEMRLLTYMAREPRKMHSRRDLLTAVWGYHPEATSRTLDTHIKRLRDKLGPMSGMIQTAHGLGYRLSDAPQQTPRTKPDSRRRR